MSTYPASPRFDPTGRTGAFLLAGAISVMAHLNLDPHHSESASTSAVAAIQLGTPTDCGRLGYSSAFLVIEYSSAPVIELAGGALALGKMTGVTPASPKSSRL